MKKLIRLFSLWLYRVTSEWVVGPHFYREISVGRLLNASLILSVARIEWHEDPEIVKAGALLRIREQLAE